MNTRKEDASETLMLSMDQKRSEWRAKSNKIRNRLIASSVIAVGLLIITAVMTNSFLIIAVTPIVILSTLRVIKAEKKSWEAIDSEFKFVQQKIVESQSFKLSESKLASLNSQSFAENASSRNAYSAAKSINTPSSSPKTERN